MISALLLITVLYILYLQNGFSDNQTRGLFGDSFGGLNTMFSGLALIGAIYAVILQTDELSLQRRELKQHRQEFVAERITNITYKQLERLDLILDSSDFQFYIKTELNDTNGRSAFILINRSIITTLKEISIDVNLDTRESTNPLYRLLFLFHNNLEDLQNIINAINSGYEMIVENIDSEEFDEKFKTDISNIYWNNIDKSFLEFCTLFYTLVLPKMETQSLTLFKLEGNSLTTFKGLLDSSYLRKKSGLLHI